MWDVKPSAGPYLKLPLERRATPELAEGWLCFESRVEKRRLAPIPAGWPKFSLAELKKLCLLAVKIDRER